jgi:hypothetical protein
MFFYHDIGVGMFGSSANWVQGRMADATVQGEAKVPDSLHGDYDGCGDTHYGCCVVRLVFLDAA